MVKARVKPLESVLKAAAFEYVRAATIAEAIALLQRHGETAKLLAGGQSLLPALNLRLSAPELLIDIGHIQSLRGVQVIDGVLRIGALTTHADLLASAAIAAHTPLLPRAVAHVAHPAIRSRGTIGGSLANADPAAELPACALATDARMVLEGPAGLRKVRASDFFTGLFGTALGPDEILTAVEIDEAPGALWGFAELARRCGDYAMVGLAVHGTPGALRLAYFGVGTSAVLARQASACIAEHGLAAPGIAAAAEALADDLEPHDDLQASAATRLHLAQVLLRRVLTPLAAPARVAA